MLRAFVVTFVLLVAGSAIAQTKEPLPRFAIDLHGASVGLPAAEGWIPAAATDAGIPGRGFGVAGAATVYPFRLGIVTFGFGAGLAAGTGNGEIVRTSAVHLTPQLSINFGHKLGWSYLSAGAGRTRVNSSRAVAGTAAPPVVPASWNQALNFGGGARWFMKPRLGAGFDVRFVKLGSRGATAVLPAARRTQMITFSAGISIQ